MFPTDVEAGPNVDCDEDGLIGFKLLNNNDDHLVCNDVVR